MKRILNLFILFFILILTIACGGNDTPSDTTDAESNDATTTLTTSSSEEATEDYVYTVSLGDYIELTPDNTILAVDKLPGVPVEDHRPGFVVEKSNSSLTPPHFSLELRDNPVVAGEHEISRMNVSFMALIDGNEVPLGCGGNEGTPDDVFMTITAVNDSTLSGSLTITLTSCDDFYTAEDVGIESVTVTADFTDVPFLPEDDA